jgi:HEAT repeat protein
VLAVNEAEDCEALRRRAADPAQHSEVRREAIESLGRMRSDDAWRALLALARDPSGEVSAAALSEMSGHARSDEVFPLLIEALAHGDPWVRDRAGDALGWLLHVGLDAGKREAAVGPLLRALADASVGVRQSAAYALSFLMDERAREPLASALADDDDYMRARAGHALASLGDHRALGVLRALVRQSADVGAACTAAEGLGLLGDLRAAPALIEGLSDARGGGRGEHLVQECVAALGRLGDRRAVSPLRRVLRDGNGAAQVEAARALGAIGGGRAARSLRRALREGEPAVREASATALGEAGRARKALRHALTDADPGVRAAAARALGRVGDRAAADALCRGLSDPDANVRRESVAALAVVWEGPRDVWLVRREAYERLLGALSDADDDVQLAAIDALVSLAWGCPERQLTALLRDGTTPVARAAAAALARLGQPAPPPT